MDGRRAPGAGTVGRHGHAADNRPGQGPARTAEEVASQAAAAADLASLDAAVSDCRACPRLVAWREEVARTRRAAFRDQEYWGRPVPGFGPADARIGILGLAPAAHGGNRTGRIFTGDRSGDVLFAALYRAGLANQPTSVHRDDGLTVTGTRIFAAVRCAPPGNQPTPDERDTCAAWLHREMVLVAPTMRVVVALGGFAWAAFWPALRAVHGLAVAPRPAFGHAAEWHTSIPGPGARASGGERQELSLLGCYHVSQQNTFTGRLTPSMLDDVLARAKHLAGLDAHD